MFITRNKIGGKIVVTKSYMQGPVKIVKAVSVSPVAYCPYSIKRKKTVNNDKD